MARGTDQVPPLEMTKWFNANYHYLVTELGPDSRFTLDATKPITEFTEAKQASIRWAATSRPGELDPPVVGGFEGNHGQFLGDDVVGGRTIRVRFDWQNISPTSSRWSQASSADEAKTWEENWVMDFTPTG
jgi:hypothetical protein